MGRERGGVRIEIRKSCARGINCVGTHKIDRPRGTNSKTYKSNKAKKTSVFKPSVTVPL